MTAVLDRLRPWAPRLPLLLLALGALLLTAAYLMPAYSDPAAFQAEMDRIRRDGYGGMGRPAFETMTRDFFAAHERYGTAKWVLADLGYASLSWAVLLAFVFWRARKGWRRITHTRRGWLIPLLLVFSLGLLIVGMFASGLQPLFREQVPAWADSAGVLLIETGFVATALVPLLGIPALIGLLRKIPPFPLIARPTAPYWPTLLVSLIFILPLVITVVSTALVWSPGSWATSPAGAILTWLLLNSRGLLVGPRAR
ncbi:MAG TPA: hypothetical protein VD906_02985 [Caulobacteraceae bacterium]|nr:hypothetical protein [Caulobacteraceae bacterium]